MSPFRKEVCRTNGVQIACFQGYLDSQRDRLCKDLGFGFGFLPLRVANNFHGLCRNGSKQFRQAGERGLIECFWEGNLETVEEQSKFQFRRVSVAQTLPNL